MEIQKSAFQLAMQQLHYDREAYKALEEWL